MLESVLLGAGFLLVLVGVLSCIYPLRWVCIRTRGMASLTITGGFLLVAIATGLLDSYLVYLGFALFFLGLVSLLRPLRFLYIRTRRTALMVGGFGLLLSAAVLLWPYRNQEAAGCVTKRETPHRAGRRAMLPR